MTRSSRVDKQDNATTQAMFSGSWGAAKKRARDADADAVDLTDDDSPEKKHKVALNAIAEELICPITQELPVEPVLAEDGRIYEKKDLLQWFGTDREAKSPATGDIIGTTLKPAPQVRNTIEALVKSGAIEGEIAEAWTKKLADETRVKEARAKAGGGDAEAMWQLGVWHGLGMNGLVKDLAQARAWFERSAAARNPKGLAVLGGYALSGKGGPQNKALGLVKVTQAAELGSNYGAYVLGVSFFRGAYGLPKDPVQARFWLKKVADGECEHKHLMGKDVADAAGWLRELEQEE